MNRIKLLREENNWSQYELANKLNCAPSSIAMYEKGNRKPSMEVLIKLSDIFNCSIDYLLCKSDIRKDIKEESSNDDDTLEIRAIARDIANLDPENKILFKHLLKQMSKKANEENK